MRIIAGEYRGRVLEAPGGRDTRPTTDRVRESIMSSVFSALGGFEGARVLDAFSGSGAMGLESLSRGAAFVALNDSAPSANSVIAKNVKALGCAPSQAKVTSVDVMRLGLPGADGPFDLVFLDPPYASSQEDVLGIIAKARDAGTLADGCLVVYEHDEPLDEVACESRGFTLRSERKLGKTYVSYILPERIPGLAPSSC